MVFIGRRDIVGFSTLVPTLVATIVARLLAALPSSAFRDHPWTLPGTIISASVVEFLVAKAAWPPWLTLLFAPVLGALAFIALFCLLNADEMRQSAFTMPKETSCYGCIILILGAIVVPLSAVPMLVNVSLPWEGIIPGSAALLTTVSLALTYALERRAESRTKVGSIALFLIINCTAWGMLIGLPVICFMRSP